jgi:predicted nucleic-acid-binding protein
MIPTIKQCFIDTNIFLRYLTKDDPVQFPRCRNLFKKAQNGEVHLVTSTLVIAELIWTLASYYRVPKEQIIEKVSIIIGSEAVQIPDRDLIAEALLLYGRKNVDYIDAYNSVLMRQLGLKEIYSYDKDFDKLETVQRLEP